MSDSIDRRSAGDQLRNALTGDLVVRAPGVHDGISARIAMETGFRAVYVSGAGSAAALGYPDMGVMTATELVGSARTIAKSAPGVWPIVDVDAGYGGVLSLRRLVDELGEVGVAAIHVEDQGYPRRCGFMAPEVFVDESEMATRIRAARDIPGGPVVIARSDGIEFEGIDRTLERVRAYQDVGAEMIMVNGVTDLAVLEAVARVATVPLLHNVSGSDKSPDLTDERARELGVKLIIYPVHAARAAAAAAKLTFEAIRDGRDLGEVPRVPFREYFRLAGWDDAQEFEDRMNEGDHA